MLTLPESVRTTLYTDFVHNYILTFFPFFGGISIDQLIKSNHKCMHNHLSPNIPKHKSRGKMYFHEKWNFVHSYKFHYRENFVGISDFSRVPPERAAYNNSVKTLKYQSSGSDYPNLPKIFFFFFFFFFFYLLCFCLLL